MPELDPGRPGARSRMRGALAYFGLVEDGSERVAQEVSLTPPWRRRLEATLVYFGLAEDEPGRERAPGLEWERLFFALVVLYLFGDDTGAGPALLYAAAFFGVLFGVVELASWRIRRSERSATLRE